MQKENDTRKCLHLNHDDSPCPGIQTYNLRRAVSHAGVETPNGDTTNMTRRAGWECSEEIYHFDLEQ